MSIFGIGCAYIRDSITSWNIPTLGSGLLGTSSPYIYHQDGSSYKKPFTIFPKALLLHLFTPMLLSFLYLPSPSYLVFLSSHLFIIFVSKLLCSCHCIVHFSNFLHRFSPFRDCLIWFHFVIFCERFISTACWTSGSSFWYSVVLWTLGWELLL